MMKVIIQTCNAFHYTLGFRNPVTICEIDTFFAEMTHQISEASNVIQALETVSSSFQSQQPGRDAKKILWVFFDGHNTDDSKDMPTDPLPFARVTIFYINSIQFKRGLLASHMYTILVLPLKQ